MKDRIIVGQNGILTDSFSGSPKTMLEVARLTNIERGSVCWWIGDKLKENRVFFCGFRICRISGSRAKVWTTNPNYYAHYVALCKDTFEALTTDQQTELATAVRDYFLSNYNPFSVAMSPELKDTWNTLIKPVIDLQLK